MDQWKSPTVTIAGQHSSVFRMFMIFVTEPVGELGFPHVAVDQLSIRITQNPLHGSGLIVVADNVTSVVNSFKTAVNISAFATIMNSEKINIIANLRKENN